jgi:sec-independent protein translocase protein TatA
MAGFGVPEMLIILAIIILLFGVGRISGVGKEMGTAIKEFRKGLQSDDSAPNDAEETKVS